MMSERKMDMKENVNHPASELLRLRISAGNALRREISLSFSAARQVVTAAAALQAPQSPTLSNLSNTAALRYRREILPKRESSRDSSATLRSQR